ncbi:hypothetical protein CU665_13655 [Pseudomonas syringae pv. actinidifoliorum]|nr:hypothetical protein [Pseudomonas syringae pv. actinidifoliorum]
MVGDHTGPFANKRSVARFAPTPCGQKPENPISDADLQRTSSLPRPAGRSLKAPFPTLTCSVLNTRYF